MLDWMFPLSLNAIPLGIPREPMLTFPETRNGRKRESWEWE
jgi:hypothetical protein